MMSWAMRLFLRHAYLVLFGWVFVEQAGLPIPSIPLMLAAGTMSSAHKLHIAYALPLILLACLVADSFWYWLGRRYGTRVLNTLCKFSLEAATCVTKTQGTVVKRGALTLLWAGGWLFAGRFFGDVVERSHKLFGTLAHFAGVLVLAAVVGVVIYRLAKREQFRRELRGLRLEPSQLQAMIADAEREGTDLPFIVDLRHPLDVLAYPEVVPGALRIAPDDLMRSKELIPRGRDIVLYCTCPSEETSAKIAMELRRMGVRRVRPLRGGLQGWKDAGFPMQGV